MAKRKTTTKRRSYAPRAAAPKRRSYRKKSGVAEIPAAAATVGMAIANIGPMQTVASDISINGVKSAAQQAIQPEQLKKTATYAVVGLAAGAAIKKFAPNFIKSPMGKVAKKIPKVF